LEASEKVIVLPRVVLEARRNKRDITIGKGITPRIAKRALTMSRGRRRAQKFCQRKKKILLGKGLRAEIPNRRGRKLSVRLIGKRALRGINGRGKRYGRT